MMMPGLMVLTRAPRLAQRTASAIDPQRVGPLGQLVGVEGVVDLVGLEHGQIRAAPRQGWWPAPRSRSVVRAARRCPDWEAMTTPAPPGR